MTIHKAGYILLLKILIVLIILNLASFYFINNTSIVYTILGITVVMYLLVVNFFRFPNRVIIQDDNTILAPADGKIVRIEEKEDPMSGETRVCVSIFMNLFNVHVNRMPVAGTIRHITYWPGKYFNASLDKASKYNERCGFLAEAADGSTWSFVQIAGLVARRIVCRTEEGDTLARGERFGRYQTGVMIETPAAVFMSRELAREVDFFSIGTNDLTQYLLAMDRQNPALAPFCDPHHPAVLRAIEETVHNAHLEGCRVGICGELAADESLTQTFLRLGVDELSVSPPRILPLRRAIRDMTLA